MSIYRKVVWYTKGLREYTKGGYTAASKHFNKSDLEVDCSGKSYMITGANSGIGKVTALEVAKKGGTVHMICRSQQRGEAAQKEIKEQSGNENVFLHLLDMSSPRKVAEFAKKFKESGEPLNVLVNNAGCMINEREVQEDGLEKNFATNTLGTHVLTVGLIPILKNNTKARVILVTSGGMLVQKLDVKDLQFERMSPFEGTMAYSQNKRQQVVMTEQYAKQYPDIHFSCMHPGWADTPAVQSSMPEFYEKMKDKLRTAEQGADTLVWLAVSDAALATPGGLFFQDRVSAAKHLPLAWTKSSAEEDQLLMKALSDFTEKFTS